MLSDAQKSSLGRVASKYNAGLTEEVRSYLEARGLGPEVVDGSLLGLVVDPDPLHEPYLGRLSIPYITPTGVVTMRFRCLNPHHEDPEYDGGCPKYTQPDGSRTHIYNVQALHDADTTVGISEGELDGLIGTLCGVPTAGIPGANNWKPYFYRLFEDYERVLIFGDGDKAGRKFASQLANTIPGGEAKVLPDGYDVTKYVLEFGQESFLHFAIQ